MYCSFQYTYSPLFSPSGLESKSLQMKATEMYETRA